MEKENTRGDRHFRGRCFLFYTKKLQLVCMEIEFPKENQKEKPDNCTKKETRNGTARMDFYN